MKFYIFKPILEEDALPSGRLVWRAYIPSLEDRGAATWGPTKEEALKNLQAVAQMVVESMLDRGETLPQNVTVSEEPVVSIAA